MRQLHNPVRPRRPDFSLAIVNIVFLLLLFYLASGSLVARSELEADVPFTRELPLELLPRPLLLLDADGSMHLDGRPVVTADLSEAVRAAAQEGGVINVLAARSMAGRDLLATLSLLDIADIEVRLVTLHASQQPGGANE
jgi:biopolymer transport protein ExbD